MSQPGSKATATGTIPVVKRFRQRSELRHLLVRVGFLLLPLQTGLLCLQLPQLLVCICQLLLQPSCSNAVSGSKKHHSNVIVRD